MLHDRTGRLEKDYIKGFSAVELHDRTGRLENRHPATNTTHNLHDRTGRLEITENQMTGF